MINNPHQSVFIELSKKGWKVEELENTNLITLRKKNKYFFWLDSFSPLISYPLGMILASKKLVRDILSEQKIKVTKAAVCYSQDRLAIKNISQE